jgi:flagellar M-ring protein FliF
MEKLKQSMSKSLMLWGTLKEWQKWSILLAAGGIIVLLVAIVILGGAPSYTTLYSGLDGKDQAAIEAHLKEKNIPYRTEPKAKAISVPKNQVDDVRIALAEAGLVKGGTTGYEIFDEKVMGETDFDKKVKYMRALEGELARTIKRIDAVEDAKVLIVLPERRLFLEQQAPSSASVMLTLRPGYVVKNEQVKAVVNLVSNGVHGLSPENVTVVDALGTNLSNMINEEYFTFRADNGSVSSIQRELERQREREYESKVKSMLEKMYGIGKVVVGVKVDLNFDKLSSTFQEFIPGETGRGVIRSRQGMEETYTGTGTPPGGAPGTTTNIPGYAASANPIASEYNKTENTDNYEITSRLTKVDTTPGDTKRVTASVAIDGELGETEINKVKSLVSNVIGINMVRNDGIDVQSIKFSTDLADALAKIMERDRLASLITASVIGFVLLALSSLLAVLWWKKRRAMLAASSASQDARHIPTIQEMLTSPDMIATQGEISVLEEQIKAYARSNPKEIANLVNEWLSED